jgi:predicted 3-demethylubiquinone-9 3-methyltransferase (glyoxalase superfamily)
MPITPCLWSNLNAEEMANFYVGLFPNSSVKNTMRAAADNPSVSQGAVLSVEIEIDGLSLTLLNGGAQFPFTEAFSLQYPCASQEVADYFYDALIADGGQESMCGWLKDKFGVSWQVYPQQLGDYVGGPNPEGAARAMAAMLSMRRIDLEALRRAYEAD